ncbi:MAG: ectoine/hydroxyectoine ABC transporter permease subunit EhuC [Castellaniella sp.]|uniref:ectoine/hydroxyectoine ABC transporter permease subunit EhuC n=1 Tax=Castellaniella sp. TaxID=1955812 RepID=UPI00121515E3|nr:ectoine/hydroxyectoine ABC transporter permease subunit EhuC [Castellaniella sp.]TAN26079.1 MAG: ectoine/hydroxyectoine ABC transporter permease subunit EhuC [Castellaniella sp.]
MQWLSYLHPLMLGARVTVEMTVYSGVLGTLFSFLFGIGRLSPARPLRWGSIAMIEIFRGTSLLVQLFWLFFALPVLGHAMGMDLRMPPVVAGTLALSLNIGAYGAEVVRGAIQAVPRSQHEAAKALDFTPRQTLWRIAIPQAIPEMMPSFSNLAVQNLKDTALVSLIGLADLAFQAERIRNFTQDSTSVYTLLLLMYFGMALVLSGLMRLLEAYVSRWRAQRI